MIQSPSNGDIVEFQHFYDTKDSAIEMVHKNFLKKSLNINKHASYTCIYKEFKRCPVTHRAWVMAIKCWIRLNSGAENCLSNEAYEMPQVENDQWLQSIHYLLNIHGFSDIWNNPSIPGDTFHKAFKLWADDQFNQSLIGKLQSSSRFTTFWKSHPDLPGINGLTSNRVKAVTYCCRWYKVGPRYQNLGYS